VAAGGVGVSGVESGLRAEQALSFEMHIFPEKKTALCQACA
jgi:hypothetical protein